MANRTNLLMALALAVAWPCAADQIGKRTDPMREKTWWLAQDGVIVRAPGGEKHIALPGWQRVGDRYACPPALAEGPLGEVLVTSNVLSSIWKIDPETLAVTVHELELDSDRDKDVGFSTLRYSSREGAWLAFSAAHGSTWRIDPTLRFARRIAQQAERRMTCATR